MIAPPMYWVVPGIINLAIMSYMDFKNNMMIDTRFNYIMMGITFSLLSHHKRTFFYVMGVLLGYFILFYVIKRYFGDGDLQTLGWLLSGFGFLDPFYFILFAVVFTGIHFIYTMVKVYLLKTKKPTPYIIIILFSYGLTLTLIYLML